MTYDNLPFPGVDIPPPSFLDQVPPFDLHALVPYEPRLLADWPAQLYNLDVEVVVEDAYDTMLALTYRQAGPPVMVSVTWDSASPRRVWVPTRSGDLISWWTTIPTASSSGSGSSSR